MLSPSRRTEPDLFLKSPHEDMASHTHPHRTFCYHGTEEENDGHLDWQQLQDGHMYAMAHPAYATRAFEVETTPPSTASLLETQNNLSTPQTVFDDGFAAPARSVNRYLDFFGNSESMLPPTGPFVSPVNQLGEWNNLPSSITFPSTLHVLPLAPNTYGHSTPNAIPTNEYPFVGTLDNNSACNIGHSASVNNDLTLMHADSYAIPSGDDYGHVMNHEFFESCMPDLQHDTPNSLLHVGMTTQYPLPSIPGPGMGWCSYDTGPSFSGEREWTVGLPRNEIKAALQSFPSYQCFSEASHVLDTPLTSERPSLSASHALNTIGPTIAIERPSKQRRLMPGSLNNTTVIDELSGGTNTSVKSTKIPGRKGKLSAKKKAQTSDMRQKRACAACFASHVECSPEDPCLRCVRHAKSPHLGIRCSRDSLQIYLESFSPHFIGEHLSQGAIEDFTNRLRFTNNEIVVELSTASSHPPIPLLVCQFIPPNEKFLYVKGSSPKSQENNQSFEDIRTLEWGVLRRNADQLIPRCLEHAQIISNRDTVIGDPKTLSWKIMQAICRFQQADPIARMNDLLAKAIMVNRLHYVLGRVVYFSSGSVDKAIRSLQNIATDLPPRSHISSRLLTKQVKGAMTDILKDLTTDLLGQYNRELRDKRPETWLLCLMTHLILCMCAEQVQWQVDTFIVFRISNGGCDPVAIRKCGTEVCRRLEYVVLEHSWDLVRGKLKTLLRNRNPFKYGYQVIEGDFPKETERDLVNVIRQVMSDHKEEVFENMAKPYFGGSSRTPADANKFRKSNIDRLVSKFLKRLY